MEDTTRYAALTFDDGPSENTQIILKTLKEYKVNGTFFVLGSKAQNYPELIKQIYAEGHVIGNHTWNHPNIKQLSDLDLIQEINSTNELLETLIGEKPKLFRPPYGKINKRNLEILHAHGMDSVMWNVDGVDWDRSDSKTIYDRVLNRIQDNSIICLHDQRGNRATLDALPMIIEQLIKLRYQFVTIPVFHNVAFKIER